MATTEVLPALLAALHQLAATRLMAPRHNSSNKVRLGIAEVQQAAEVERQRYAAGAEQDDHDSRAGHHLCGGSASKADITRCVAVQS